MMVEHRFFYKSKVDSDCRGRRSNLRRNIMAESSVTPEASAKRAAMPTIRRELPGTEAPRSCAQLLGELRPPAHIESHTLEFALADERDVYNITAPFQFNGKKLILGRVEMRDTELSEIVAFEQSATGKWIPCFRHKEFHGLQDPCIAWAGDELILGGVRFPMRMANGTHYYIMDFYRGRSLSELRHFLSGPPGMKDIRFRQLPDGRVVIFSRPQGIVGGRGEIGFTIAPSWNDITSDMIATAPLFKGQFLKEEWGGVNEVHQLANGNLGLLGHIACFDTQGDRHYYPMAFSLNLDSRDVSPIRIIARRSFFPPGPSKRKDLVDVVFSGGLVRNTGGSADLYAGTSDAAAAVVRIADPFLEFEN